MRLEPDELAGVVDLFGGLTRAELGAAVADLAARSGEPFDVDVLSAAVDQAVEDYYLVAIERETTERAVDETGTGSSDGGGDERFEDVVVAGPASLPRLPEGGEDLPHLLDVERRSVDQASVGAAALARLHRDAALAVDGGDDERVATLLDVCYDLEAWAPVSTDELRERLDAVL